MVMNKRLEGTCSKSRDTWQEIIAVLTGYVFAIECAYLPYCRRQILFYAPIIFSDYPGAIPRTPNVTFSISRQQFTITWDEPLNMGGPVDAYFVNISGPNDLCGNGNTLQRVTERNYTCSGPMTTDQIYTFTVQAVNCDGDQTGPESDPIAVSLRGMLKGFFHMKKFSDNIHRI